MQSFFLKAGRKWISIQPKEILSISKSDKRPNYLVLNTKKGKIETRFNLKKNLYILPINDIIQIHKSYLVRVDKIVSIDQDFGYLKIENKLLPIGDSYVPQLKEKFLFLAGFQKTCV